MERADKGSEIFCRSIVSVSKNVDLCSYLRIFVLFGCLFVLFGCLFVLFYVLFVCKCVLSPGDNPIAVNKYINISIIFIPLNASCGI